VNVNALKNAWLYVKLWFLMSSGVAAMALTMVIVFALFFRSPECIMLVSVGMGAAVPLFGLVFVYDLIRRRKEVNEREWQLLLSEAREGAMLMLKWGNPVSAPNTLWRGLVFLSKV
jgi:hypothetical protein